MRLLSFFLALTLAACGSETSPFDADPPIPEAGRDADAVVDAPPSGPRVELGTGTTSFLPISQSGAPQIDLVLGPQGGWHIHASVRLYEMDVDRCYLLYELRNRAGEVANYPAEIILSERRLVREGNHWLRSGDFVILDITMPDDVVGETMTLEVSARPQDGEVYRAQREITIGPEVDGTGGPAPG